QTTGSATLQGLVRDPTRAVVAHASVAITSQRTGEQRNATTSDEGRFVFASLDPGSYTLKVEAAGFKLYEQNDVVLNPSDTRGIDVVLQVGSPSETVVISGGEASQIQTETGAKEQTITAKQIDNLAIVRRSSLELLRILPGVVAPDSTDLQSVSFSSGSNNTS